MSPSIAVKRSFGALGGHSGNALLSVTGVALGSVLDNLPGGALGNPLSGAPDGARPPLLRAGRPLKRWRYVGVFCEELMACAALVQVGVVKQSFWALYVRARTRAHGSAENASSFAGGSSREPLREPLRERTRTLVRRRAVALPAGGVAIADGGVLLDLALEEDRGIQARCPHGGGEVWTRKQAGVRAHGMLALDGGPARTVEALAVIDDTIGYHARHTEWWWSAGVGASADGRALAWNLVQGVNDPPTGSERTVWVDGAPSEVGPVRFAADLSEILATDGSRLTFAAEAMRRRRENLLIASSDYTAPFGTFAGALPGSIRLAHGLGVMEHHRAKW